MNIFTCSHAHSAAVSTFKWHFCPDKYWKWTRPPLSTFLRLHPFTAYMWAHLHSDQFSVAMSKSYFQYLLCWGVAREWGGSISKSSIGISKNISECYLLKCHLQIEIWTDWVHCRVERVGFGEWEGSRYKLTAGAFRQKLIKKGEMLLIRVRSVLNFKWCSLHLKALWTELN